MALLAHHHRGHARGPACIVLLHRRKQLADVVFLEAAGVAALIHEARRGRQQHQPPKPGRLLNGRQDADNRANRVTHEYYVVYIQLAQHGQQVVGVRPQGAIFGLIVGAGIRLAGAHQVKQHYFIAVLKGRGQQPPATLVRAEAVQEYNDWYYPGSPGERNVAALKNRSSGCICVYLNKIYLIFI